MTSRCNDASGIGGWFPGSCCLPEGHEGPHEDDDGVRWRSDVPLGRIARRLHDARRADVKGILDRTYEDPQDYCRILTVPHLQGLRKMVAMGFDDLDPDDQAAYLRAAQQVMLDAYEMPRQVMAGEQFFAPCGCAVRLEPMQFSPALVILRACRMHRGEQTLRACHGRPVSVYLVRADGCIEHRRMCTNCGHWAEPWAFVGTVCCCGTPLGWRRCANAVGGACSGTGATSAQ